MNRDDNEPSDVKDPELEPFLWALRRTQDEAMEEFDAAAEGSFAAGVLEQLEERRPGVFRERIERLRDNVRLGFWSKASMGFAGAMAAVVVAFGIQRVEPHFALDAVPAMQGEVRIEKLRVEGTVTVLQDSEVTVIWIADAGV